MLENIQEIIAIAIMGLGLVSTIIGWIISIKKGELKEFVMQKIEEAEKTGKSGEEKLNYVLEAVKEKYKLLTFGVNVIDFVEKIIDFTKKVNVKK